MNLKMEKNVNFDIIKMFLLKKTLELDFRNGLSTTNFVIV
jgi:hypothetical protein